MDEQREHILKGTIAVYAEHGPKFTMSDLAKKIGMSKKTIYLVFEDKESLLNAMVDYFFDDVKEAKRIALANAGESYAEKLTAVMGCMPEAYKGIDFSQMYLFKEKYNIVYQHIKERVESDWEETIAVLNAGIEAGEFRPIDITVFELTFEAAIERFLVGDELERGKIDYADALKELVSIMIDGIKA